MGTTKSRGQRDRATKYQNDTWLTLNEIASQLGTSKRELQWALHIE